MRWRLGTMGFSYRDWAGAFYPPGTKPGDYLAHYARHFDAVELDTTFYATPPRARVERWAAAVPEDFRFCMKMPRAVTHELPTARAADELRGFADAALAFGEKLGVILLQFPPSFEFPGGMSKLDRLAGAAAATGLRYAVELRDGSWGQRETLDLLAEHRVALVAAEYLSVPRVIPVTADFLYVRWIGQHERFQQLDHEQVDMGGRLAWWKAKLDAAGAPAAWGFFNNDYAGYSVATCNRMKRLVGLPVRADTSPTLF